ncbi:MAG: hypothetical protein ACR2P4_03040 [Gammaproteobacteria bacterium]
MTTANDNWRQLLDERKQHSGQKLGKLEDAVGQIAVLNKLHRLCIYVTGSYGRLEAHDKSDIDLFFLHAGTRQSNRIAKLDEVPLYAALIEGVRDLGFPPFSNDGEYLKVHYLGDLLAEMGGRGDDWQNHFTARMLLLLESRPVHNEGEYKRAAEEVVRSYCRDIYDSNKDFRNAIFLINDILRYWRTMCVNYEYRRNEPHSDIARYNKDMLRNLKLKFSRMLLCFSAVLLLVREGQKPTMEEILRIVRLSPMERLEEAGRAVAGGEQLAAAVRDNYAWFLDKTGKEECEVLRWIEDKTEREKALVRARQFGDDMHNLIRKSAGQSGIMRFLVL